MVLLTVVGTVGYVQSRRSITRHARKHLASIARDHSHEVALWISDRMRDISFYTSLPSVRELTTRMVYTERADRSDSLRMNEIFQVFYNIYKDFGPCGIYDLQGNPLVFAGDYPPENARVTIPPPVMADLQSGNPAFQLLPIEVTGTPIIRILESINDPNGHPLAILAFVIFPEKTFKDLLVDSTGLGETGEIYIVDSDTVMLTPPRHLSAETDYHQKIFTEGVSHCLSGKDSTGIYMGYHGKKVLGAYTWMPKQNWGMMVEISLAEALQPLDRIKSQFMLIGGITVLIILLISAWISRQITRPLYRLATASRAIANGDTDVQLKPFSSDEIGDLTNQFNVMVDALKQSRQQVEKSMLKLVQAEKLAAIGKLVASIVHEMRNPLSTVKMNLRIMEKKGDLSDALGEHLLIAKDQVTRLERMLNELLEYSKPVQADIDRIDVKRLIERISSDVSTKLAEKKVQLIQILPDHPIEIRSDSDLLSRIFDNILSNAIEASIPGGEIRIEMLDTEDLRIVISDRGTGMSEKILDQVFEPFFTTRGNGIGLGMPNVKKFVEALEARIDVESREGEGTTFTLIFPKETHA